MTFNKHHFYVCYILQYLQKVLLKADIDKHKFQYHEIKFIGLILFTKRYFNRSIKSLQDFKLILTNNFSVI